MLDALLNAVAPLAGIGLALALGLLVGIERGWSHRNDPDGSRVAGIRTFALLGLAGGIAGQAWTAQAAWLGVIAAGGAVAALLIGYAAEARKGEVSATTTLVGILTVAIGVLAASGQALMASVAAAVVTLLLASRRQLHDWLDRMSEAEIQAIVRFAVISLAILPVLPDQAYGPFDAWNPRHLWLVVVLVSAISLGGYAAGKVFGPSKGILATAAAGAIVSSTAVAGALAARLKHDEGQASVLVAGIAIASAVMFVRVLVLTALLAPFALVSLALLIGPAALANVAVVTWLMRGVAKSEAPDGDMVKVRNPFDMVPALVLAGLVMVLSLFGRWMMSVFGGAGLATVLAVSGMVDVDSAIITLGGLPPGSVDARMAGLILAAPVLLNTLVKAGMAVAIAGVKTGFRAAVPLLVSIGCGLAAAPVVWLLA